MYDFIQIRLANPDQPLSIAERDARNAMPAEDLAAWRLAYKEERKGYLAYLNANQLSTRYLPKQRKKAEQTMARLAKHWPNQKFNLIELSSCSFFTI